MPELSAELRITYVGHATVLMELDGRRLLTDPVLRDRVAFLRRQWPAPGPEPASRIDAVLLSHLHHDHVDLPSLRRLDRSTLLIAPRGAGPMLRRQGFRSIAELGPGEETAVGGVRIVATAAAHPAGRRLFARPDAAIGFEIAGSRRAYFAGDTDLFTGMEELAAGLDLALLPIAGWGRTLGPGHLDPQRAARAAALLAPRLAVPIHWGTFRPLGLRRPSRESLKAPAREFARWAQQLAPQVEVRVLEPGEAASLS